MKIPEAVHWKKTGKTIGQGGQGQVHEVKRENDDKTYAMKVLSKGKPAVAYERFNREISALKNLQHEYVIDIIDHSKEGDEFVYYVMEYIEDAIPLKSIIGSGTVNAYHGELRESLLLFNKILTGISYLSNNGIIHRDLSPGNILLLPDGSIRIIDLGLCHSVDHETVTLLDEGVGTINYMAPECESGVDSKIDVRADIYSAGKILWSLVANQSAFSRERPVFQNKSMFELFPDNPKLWHLHNVFEKTIRHRWQDRWQNADIAVSESSRVLYVADSGYPPLEHIEKRCSLCGYGEMKRFSGAHSVFGNPNPSGIEGVKCDNCGGCMPIDYKLLSRKLDDRKTLA